MTMRRRTPHTTLLRTPPRIPHATPPRTPSDLLSPPLSHLPSQLLPRRHPGRRTSLEPLGWPLIRLSLVVMVGGVAPLIDTTVVNVALHAIGQGFGVGPAAVQWVSTAYLLALAAAVPVTTWASDRFGTTASWVAGLGLFTVGSGLCAGAWSFGALVACRALQGVGAGVMLPLMQTILVRAAGPAKLGRVLTTVMLFATIAPIAGPLVGGAIVGASSWRWVFVVNLPLCLAAIGLALRYLARRHARRGTHLDVLGVLLLGGGMVALLGALSGAASGGVASGGTGAVVRWPLAAGLALTAAFVVRSLRRGDAAAIPLRLFADRTFAAVNGVLFLTGLALYGALFLVPLYFQQQRGTAALTAGGILALQGVGSLLTRWVGGVVDRIGARLIAVVGIVVCAAATVPFAVATARTGTVLLAVALVVRGGALSAVNVAITTNAFAGLSPQSVPAGAAVIRLIQQVGGSAGTALLATVLAGAAAAGRLAGAAGQLAGFHAAFAWSVGLTVLALVPCALIPARPRTTSPAGAPAAMRQAA
ncbi:MAG: DHA2 family efflux MFS transporter permease subunit [Micrococcales bacterium]|nr:DHA2 family efflux MFS transporter permease subunit [Micrococcales bacterium]